MPDSLPRANQLFSFRVVASFGVVATLAIALATIAYQFVPDAYHGAFIFCAAATAAIGQLGAVLYAGRLLQFTIENQNAALRNVAEKDAIADQRFLESAAAHFGERWNDASMFHMRKASRVIIDLRHKPDEILSKINESDDIQVNVSNILNFLEEMAISVNRKRCDDVVAKALFCGIVVNIWHSCEQWAKQQRTNRGRSQLWTELEMLYGRWK
jgi:hypothetical protein